MRIFSRRVLVPIATMVVVVYVTFFAYVDWAMHQSPEKFGHVMARMPGPVVFLLFPFEKMWTRARAGNLNVGDRAPDFSLTGLDKSHRVQLSTLNQQQPVVLVFGSYT